MIIRKMYRYEGSHAVRNCSSDRCKYSVHGHSYIVEVFLTSDGLDNGMMVMDFGLMKGNIKDIIDSFDHAHSMWNKETSDYKEFFKSHCARWIEMPVSPSAEAYAIMFFKMIDAMLLATKFANGERRVQLHSVRVHETATGYAEAFREDLEWVDFDLDDIVFSDGVKEEWQDPDMYDKLLLATQVGDKCFFNKPVTQQV